MAFSADIIKKKGYERGAVKMAKDNKNTVTCEMLIDYLIDFSSEVHKVSVNEMFEYFLAKIYFAKEYMKELKDLDESLEQEFYEMFVSSPVYSADYDKLGKSTKVQIRRLLAENLNKKKYCGIRICSSVPYEKAVVDGKLKIKSDEKVFYVQRLLDEPSINLLRDALEVFPYAETGTTREIIHQLNMLTPGYNRKEFDPKRVSARKYPGTYYQNLEEITKAFRTIKEDTGNQKLTSNQKKMTRAEYDKIQIKEVNKISFQYCEYDENKNLKIRKLRNGSDVRTVNPVKIMWANGFYYLVTALKKHNQTSGDDYIYINYRIDRMINVRCLDETAKIPENFSPDIYKSKNPVMYTDSKPENVIKIKCSKSLINNALDTFGFDIMITPCKDSDDVIITLNNSSHIGVKMWALEYGDRCEIVSPKSLRNEMKAAAQHLIRTYSD